MINLYLPWFVLTFAFIAATKLLARIKLHLIDFARPATFATNAWTGRIYIKGERYLKGVFLRGFSHQGLQIRSLLFINRDLGKPAFLMAN